MLDLLEQCVQRDWLFAILEDALTEWPEPAEGEGREATTAMEEEDEERDGNEGEGTLAEDADEEKEEEGEEEQNADQNANTEEQGPENDEITS